MPETQLSCSAGPSRSMQTQLSYRRDGQTDGQTDRRLFSFFIQQTSKCTCPIVHPMLVQSKLIQFQSASVPCLAIGVSYMYRYVQDCMTIYVAYLVLYLYCMHACPCTLDLLVNLELYLPPCQPAQLHAVAYIKPVYSFLAIVIPSPPCIYHLLIYIAVYALTTMQIL